MWVRTISALAAAFLVVGAAAAATGDPGTAPPDRRPPRTPRRSGSCSRTARSSAPPRPWATAGRSSRSAARATRTPATARWSSPAGSRPRRRPRRRRRRMPGRRPRRPNISLFDGEITLSSAGAHATAATSAGRAGGSFTGTGLGSLQALGRRHAFGRAALADWGYLVDLGPQGRTSRPRAAARSTTGSRSRSTCTSPPPHGGLPAGSEIQVGYAAASARRRRLRRCRRPGRSPPTTRSSCRRRRAARRRCAAARRAGTDGGAVRLPGLRADVVHGPVRDGRQGSSWQHGDRRLRRPRPAARRRRRRHALRRRLEPRRRQPPVASRPAGEHVPLLAPLGVLDARVERRPRQGRAGDRLHGRHRQLRRDADAPPLRGAPGLDALPRPGRRRRPRALPRRVAAHGDAWPSPVATGWAPKVPGTIKAPEPGAVLLGEHGHLDRERPRPAVAPAGATPAAG